MVVLYGMPEANATLPCPTLELFAKEAACSLHGGLRGRAMSQAINYLQQDEAFFSQMIGKQVNLEQAM